MVSEELNDTFPLLQRLRLKFRKPEHRIEIFLTAGGARVVQKHIHPLHIQIIPCDIVDHKTPILMISCVMRNALQFFRCIFPLRHLSPVLTELFHLTLLCPHSLTDRGDH